VQHVDFLSLQALLYGGVPMNAFQRTSLFFQFQKRIAD
jgi:hypothetical protein